MAGRKRLNTKVSLKRKPFLNRKNYGNSRRAVAVGRVARSRSKEKYAHDETLFLGAGRRRGYYGLCCVHTFLRNGPPQELCGLGGEVGKTGQGNPIMGIAARVASARGCFRQVL